MKSYWILDHWLGKMSKLSKSLWDVKICDKNYFRIFFDILQTKWLIMIIICTIISMETHLHLAGDQ